MFSIAGIGNSKEVAVARPTTSRARDTQTSPVTEQDDIAISEDATRAAEAVRILRESLVQSEIREERVETAKKNILVGGYKVQEALLGVAVKVAPYLQ
jgi:anti-sigma28 factor (negative regulator of flagellin synthesis)